MKVFFQILVVLFSILALNSCSDSAIKDSMIQFDRAFIPAWYCAYTGDLDGAEKAMIPLTREWQRFEQTYRDPIYQKGDWTESVRLTGNWIEEANCAIEDGDLRRALVQLDHARYELMDLRYLYEIDNYYLDAVWNLETTIAVAIETAEDRKLKLLEWEEFVDLSKGVNHAWQNLLREPFDPETFEMTEADRLMLARRKSDLNKAIQNYLKAVDTADGDRFEIAAKNMEPAYLNFLASFGDFEDMRTFFAAAP